ncbi:MAG TPA: PEP-CTERM sorting domain-containing protein [Alphaproteobacteria bacterium]|nr:PEP-CTERM sorting domain-containing protein [Alphaproteobacteria bacterium]
MKTTACAKTGGIAASITLLALGFSSATAFAAATASDTAGNYLGTWGTSPANNGFGFGAWNVNVENNNNPPYAGTYLAGSGDTPIVDGSGNAWGTYANSAQGTVLPGVVFTRPFLAGPVSGSASLYNQTFSFDMGSGGVGPGQGLLSGAIGSAFLFEYDGTYSGDNMLLSIDGGTAAATPVNFSELNAGINVSLAVSGAVNSLVENYVFTVSAFSGGATLFSQSGTFDSLDFNTSQFQYTDSNTTGNGYFNTLNISAEPTPEPSTLAMMGISGLSTLFAFRRRK